MPDTVPSPTRAQQAASEQNLPGIDPGYVFKKVVQLLQCRWPNATMLAEQLYAGFTTNQPFSIAGPMQVINQTQAANAARQFNLGDFSSNMPPGINGRRAALQLMQPPQTPQEQKKDQQDPGSQDPIIEAIGDGIISEQRLTPDGIVTQPNSGVRNQPAPTPNISGVGGGGAVILLTAGSGSTYTCSVYGAGTSSGPTDTSATAVALGLASGENLTIDSTSYYVAAAIGGSYYFRPDLWS